MRQVCYSWVLYALHAVQLARCLACAATVQGDYKHKSMTQKIDSAVKFLILPEWSSLRSQQVINKTDTELFGSTLFPKIQTRSNTSP